RERLALVGQLAGGVAHDIRNVLTGVGGLLELALERDDVSDDLRDDLEQATTVLQRASSVAERLLVFSRGRTLNPESLELGAHLERAVRVFDKMLRDDIALRAVGPDEPVWIMIDVGQLDQVLLNLLKNAEEAMPGGGEVEVEVVAGAEATAPFPDSPDLDPETDWARVTVRDTGVGMDFETRTRALEPFFTTKGDGDTGSGSGTGLGLATVFGAVTQSGGELRIDSTPGEGTEVHLFFPVTDERPVRAEVAAPEGATGGRVLLVEDEEAVLHVVSRALEQAGHEVTAVQNGAEAWDRFRGDPDAFDLVITDAVMPEMSGVRLAQQILDLSPATPLIIMTGYTEEELEGDLDWNDVHFVEKPFRLDELRALVGRLLNGM
ncbi:MAG: response regulator, partial [Longimicrobiales bacterium]|nr:response regulator [Longimicrobiales bacterium]